MKLNLQIYMALVLLAIVTAFGTAIWVTLQLLPAVIHLIESLAR